MQLSPLDHIAVSYAVWLSIYQCYVKLKGSWTLVRLGDKPKKMRRTAWAVFFSEAEAFELPTKI